MVHPHDAGCTDAWRAAFVGVEGGGHGRLVISPVHDTWRITCVDGLLTRRTTEAKPKGNRVSLVLSRPAPTVPANQQSPWIEQLNIAPFGKRIVISNPLIAFAVALQERLPVSCLGILIACAWRDSQRTLLARERRSYGCISG